MLPRHLFHKGLGIPVVAGLRNRVSRQARAAMYKQTRCKYGYGCCEAVQDPPASKDCQLCPTTWLSEHTRHPRHWDYDLQDSVSKLHIGREPSQTKCESGISA